MSIVSVSSGSVKNRKRNSALCLQKHSFNNIFLTEVKLLSYTKLIVCIFCCCHIFTLSELNSGGSTCYRYLHFEFVSTRVSSLVCVNTVCKSAQSIRIVPEFFTHDCLFWLSHSWLFSCAEEHRIFIFFAESSYGK